MGEQGELKKFPSSHSSGMSGAGVLDGIKHGALSNPCSCPSCESDVSTVASTSGVVSTMPTSVVHEGLENVPACAKDFPERLGLALSFLCTRSAGTPSAQTAAL